MINSLELIGFKRFSETKIKFSPLTVLTGLNGSGKTSVIHALLLMREAACSSSNGFVSLNGPFGLQLGTVEDVSNWRSEDNIRFVAHDEFGPHTWEYASSADDAMFISVMNFPDSPPEAFKTLPGAFAYISADRFGPRSSFTASSLPVELLEVGVQGENCAHILEVNGNKQALEDRRHPSSTSPFLLKYEVERWLGEIARPVVVESIHHAGAASYALRFKAPGGEWVRATNMGFGVSYALPVILAGLTAKQGGMLIVENPEAHLHPSGQSRMGTFLAWLASKGVQVVVETHSDHVINGIRRAIGDFEMLAASNAVVHFFESDESSEIKELHFTEQGGMSNWPAGFFDQYQIDTAALGRVRRRRADYGVRS